MDMHQSRLITYSLSFKKRNLEKQGATIDDYRRPLGAYEQDDSDRFIGFTLLREGNTCSSVWMDSKDRTMPAIALLSIQKLCIY